jgi:hypothetical protein
MLLDHAEVIAMVNLAIADVLRAGADPSHVSALLNVVSQIEQRAHAHAQQQAATEQPQQ